MLSSERQQIFSALISKCSAFCLINDLNNYQIIRIVIKFDNFLKNCFTNNFVKSTVQKTNTFTLIYVNKYATNRIATDSLILEPGKR